MFSFFPSKSFASESRQSTNYCVVHQLHATYIQQPVDQVRLLQCLSHYFKYLVSDFQLKAIMNLDMVKIPAEVQTECQNEEESWLNVAWFLMSLKLVWVF